MLWGKRPSSIRRARSCVSVSQYPERGKIHSRQPPVKQNYPDHPSPAFLQFARPSYLARRTRLELASLTRYLGVWAILLATRVTDLTKDRRTKDSLGL